MSMGGLVQRDVSPCTLPRSERNGPNDVILQGRVDSSPAGDWLREEPGVPDAGLPLRRARPMHHHRRVALGLTHGGSGLTTVEEGWSET